MYKIFITAIIALLITSCNLSEEEREIIKALNENTSFVQNKIFHTTSYIREQIEEKGRKKYEEKVLEGLDSLIKTTYSSIKKLDSSQSLSSQDISNIEDLFNNLKSRYHTIYNGDHSVFKDSISFQTPKSEVQIALFKNNITHALMDLTNQGSGLLGTCDWVIWPDYRAGCSKKKESYEIILYPASYIPINGHVGISNVMINDSLINSEVKQIGSCFYINLKTKLKDKDQITYGLQYNYQGDSIFYHKESQRLLL